MLNIGSVFGRCIPGHFADRYGYFNIAILAIMLSVIAVVDIWLPFGNTSVGLVSFALIFGLSSGSNISLTPVSLTFSQDFSVISMRSGSCTPRLCLKSRSLEDEALLVNPQILLSIAILI